MGRRPACAECRIRETRDYTRKRKARWLLCTPPETGAAAAAAAAAAANHYHGSERGQNKNEEKPGATQAPVKM